MTEIRRRPCGVDFAADLHPVLKRVYAARGIACAQDLDLSLERLLPVSTLEGVERAAHLLAAHRDGGRVLIVGDFDADGATGQRPAGVAHCAASSSRTSISSCRTASASATGSRRV